MPLLNKYYFGAYLIHIELAIVNNMSYSEQYEMESLLTVANIFWYL